MLMSSFSSTQAQSISVTLGRAADFGLLTGGSLSTDSTAVQVEGKAGAANTASANMYATDSLLTNGTGSVTGALTDAQAAITYVQNLSVPTALPTQLSVGGLYEYSGNLILDTTNFYALTGDTTTSYVIRVTGNLLVKTRGGASLNGRLRTHHVIWVIGGNLTCEAFASLPGIVLVAGTTSVTGSQLGDQALLGIGGISFFAQDPGIGRSAYLSAAILSLPPTAQAVAGPPNCTQLYGQNFLLNGGAENFVRVGRTISNMTAGRSDVVGWDAASGSPDYFNKASAAPSPTVRFSVGTPDNYFGSQVPQRQTTNFAYMGLYAFSKIQGGTGDFYDYIHQPFGDRHLEAGRWYYGEFYVSRGDKCAASVSSIGMFVAEEDAPRRWFTNSANTIAILRLVPPGGTYTSTTPLAIPQIRYKEQPNLASKTQWVRISGAFQATGNERCALIGTFERQNSNVLNASAYYYVDDATLTPFPRASVAKTVIACGSQVTLGSDDCPLPLGAKAVYWWTDDIGSAPTAFSLAPEHTVTVSQTTTYTLHTRVEFSGGQFQDVTSSVTVSIQPTLCRRSCQELGLNYITTDKINSDFIFEAGQTYVLPSSLLIKNAAVVTAKSGAVLLMPVGGRIELDEASTLALNGATITNSCNELWDGIYLLDAASRFIGAAGTTTVPGRRSEISFSTNGVVLSDNPSAAAFPPMRVEYTDFRHNLRHLTWRLEPGMVAPSGSYLRYCTFDSDPELLQEAMSASSPQYGLWGVRVSGDLRTCLITHNDFGRGWLGVFATENVRLGSPTLHSFTDNTFTNEWLAGVYAGGSQNRIVCENSVFLFPQETYPQAGRQFGAELQPLIQPYENEILFHPQRDYTTFGLFNPHGAVTLTGNRFEQPDLTAYANLTAPPFLMARNWQVGAYVNDADNSIIQGNRFQVLHTGLLGMKANSSVVADNVFLECEYGIWVTAPNGVAGNNKICITCNSFIRNNQLQAPYTSGHQGLPGLTWAGYQPVLYGTMYPIYVEHADALKIAEFRTPYLLKPNGTLMGNLFFDALASLGSPSNPIIGHQRAIVQVEPTPPLEYTTYDDEIGSELLQPYTILTTNTSTPSYHGALHVDVGAPLGPVRPNFDCAFLGYQQGLQSTLTRSSGRIAGLPLPSSASRHALAPSTPNPFEGDATLTYQLDGPVKEARIDVRDLTGRLVRSLILPSDATGTGTVRLTLSGQPAGVYIGQLVVGNSVRATQRLLLLSGTKH